MPFPDPRFFRAKAPLNIESAASLAGAVLVRRGSAPLTTLAEAAVGGEGALTFAEKLKAEPAPAAAIVVSPGLGADVPPTIGTVFEADSPRLAFAVMASAMFESRFERPADDDDDAPDIHPSARVNPSAWIGPGAQVGADVVVGPGAVIGHGVVLGEGSFVSAQASITHARIGRHCRISAGARIGECGFGYAPSARGPALIPQFGTVRLGDQVDIGANTTIDRGMLSDTVLGDMCKIDNLCQIGHNCELGQAVIAASQTGISGSCRIGDGVMMGGQVGMADHIEVGAGALLSARSGLMKNVGAGAKVGGFPAKPIRQWMKEQALIGRLTSKTK